ncbi:hypothetical protein C5167_043477 [Papaver somniferum]|uniref:Uncharacterized protein n=1 Tax=Papaver somniferum TaxID=3469 RepID=A0A4Y7L8B6_PAPSO|nr:hypothetical protein C5167_043477 [Papaver somniferum]
MEEIVVSNGADSQLMAVTAMDWSWICCNSVVVWLRLKNKIKELGSDGLVAAAVLYVGLGRGKVWQLLVKQAVVSVEILRQWTG